jgi:hypothetical protein
MAGRAKGKAAKKKQRMAEKYVGDNKFLGIADSVPIKPIPPRPDDSVAGRVGGVRNRAGDSGRLTA